MQVLCQIVLLRQSSDAFSVNPALTIPETGIRDPATPERLSAFPGPTAHDSATPNPKGPNPRSDGSEQAPRRAGKVCCSAGILPAVPPASASPGFAWLQALTMDRVSTGTRERVGSRPIWNACSLKGAPAKIEQATAGCRHDCRQDAGATFTLTGQRNPDRRKTDSNAPNRRTTKTEQPTHRHRTHEQLPMNSRPSGPQGPFNDDGTQPPPQPDGRKPARFQAVLFAGRFCIGPAGREHAVDPLPDLAQANW